MFIMLNKSIDKREQYEITPIYELVPNNYLLHKIDVKLHRSIR